MAYASADRPVRGIERRVSYGGSVRYCVRIRRGPYRVFAAFATAEEAVAWRKAWLVAYARGEPLPAPPNGASRSRVLAASAAGFVGELPARRAPNGESRRPKPPPEIERIVIAARRVSRLALSGAEPRTVASAARWLLFLADRHAATKVDKPPADSLQ